MDTFEEIGMADPFDTKSSLAKTLTYVKQFDFYSEVYPNQVMTAVLEACQKKANIHPPKTVFVPTKKLLRKMIRSVL